MGAPDKDAHRLIPSASPQRYFRVESAELDPRVGGPKLPIDALEAVVSIGFPRGHMSCQLRLVADPFTQCLLLQHAQLTLGHVEPRTVFGRVDWLDPFDQSPRLGRLESLVEA